MKIGVIRFPGTNCDRDVARAIELAGLTPEYIWWNQEDLTDFDGIVIPGGFSYGDYLRLPSLLLLMVLKHWLKRKNLF